MYADLKMKQEKQDQNVSSFAVSTRDIFLAKFDIVVNAFLRCCTPILIAPEVFTSSGRLRIRSPALKFLLNWIQNQDGSLSLY